MATATEADRPGLVRAYAQRFGPEAAERLEAWARFAAALKALGPAEPAPDLSAAAVRVLEAVNAFFNRIPFRPDRLHWGQEDYWATPAELVASNGGDCEDYAIAKYFLLRELGVPPQRMRITYVRSARLGEAHMVLAYYARPDADPLVLDNLEDAVRPASARADLLPVYMFNEDDVVMVADARRSGSMQIRAWRELKRKLELESRM